jgi:hypothetical protein
MKVRPILFSAPMVRALLDGSKTQTRRVVKAKMLSSLGDLPHVPDWIAAEVPQLCPYGKPGDRLWVRETWRGVVEISPPGATVEYGVARYVPDQEHCRRVEYAATKERDGEPYRPSIHMPRWASRILLEVVSVRVERLQGISAGDCHAEGIGQCDGLGSNAEILDLSLRMGTCTAAVLSYATLWEQINGAGSWDVNPWVWVVEFKRVVP